jgi:Tol biopolymer transport system component
VSLAIGSSLLHYTIVGPLGAGAMGEVWRARDTKLGREVAIKVLPEHFADDPDRLRRFEREAKSLATVNHPNVAQIFGVDQVGDTCFLVLELVTGEPLDERLKRGPLPIAEALDVCRQIAEGLEAAHEAGVIHRDLKPANVRITPEGKVKLLDFGLAKPANEGKGGSSTDSVLSTEAGRLLGTPTYMAPEQARGKPIDKRVDIWAFGCVLYECLTGKRAFDGETLTDVLTSVLHQEIDRAALPAATPTRVRELLARCLEKDPHRRLRDIGEARLVLEHPHADEAGPRARSSSTAVRILGAACLLLTTALAFVLFRGPVRGPIGVGNGGSSASEPARPIRTAVRLPAGLHLDLETNIGETTILAISPDGTTIAFVASDGSQRRLYLRSLSAFDVVAVPGSEDAAAPFFSPDSRSVAFTAHGRLYKAAVSGGAPVELCEDAMVGRGGAWGVDGTIVFPAGLTTGLMRVSSSGGRAEKLTELDAAKGERTHRWPAFLPGWKEVAYTVGLEGKSAEYDDCEIDAVTLSTGKTRHLGLRASCVRATEVGELLFARQGRIYATPIEDLVRGQAREPAVLLQGVAGVETSGAVHFDVSRNGTLVYAEADPHAGEGQLAWVSREGKVEALSLPVRRYALPTVSPDGSKIAVTIVGGNGSGSGTGTDVWIHDLRLGSMARLTSDGASNGSLWTPDGTRVSFQSRRDARGVMAQRLADGSGDVEALHETAGTGEEWPASWTPDGGELVFLSEMGPPNSADLFALSMADKKTRTILATPAVEYSGLVSPDGKWLAIASFNAGRSEIWVQAFAGGVGRWQISESGAMPCWSRDGKELFFVDGPNMMAVKVTSAPSFAASEAVRLFALEFPTSINTSRNWDVGPDGRFLVVLRTSKESLGGHIDVVQNWVGEAR